MDWNLHFSQNYEGAWVVERSPWKVLDLRFLFRKQRSLPCGNFLPQIHFSSHLAHCIIVPLASCGFNGASACGTRTSNQVYPTTRPRVSQAVNDTSWTKSNYKTTWWLLRLQKQALIFIMTVISWVSYLWLFKLPEALVLVANCLSLKQFFPFNLEQVKAP